MTEEKTGQEMETNQAVPFGSGATDTMLQFLQSQAHQDLPPQTAAALLALANLFCIVALLNGGGATVPAATGVGGQMRDMVGTLQGLLDGGTSPKEDLIASLTGLMRSKGGRSLNSALLAKLVSLAGEASRSAGGGEAGKSSAPQSRSETESQ
ncbi:MAG: hypothetical protein ACOX2J_01360 [Bacillota bacterium]